MTEKTTEGQPSAPDVADRMLRRQPIVWTAAVLALGAAGIAVVPIWNHADRFYRFDWLPLWALPTCWTAAVVLLVLSPKLGSRRTPVQVVLAALLAPATVLAWPVSIWAEKFNDYGPKLVAVEVSPGGRHEAVTESFWGNGDPASCQVWLRERGGPFSRQTLVWIRIAADCPQRVSFTDDTTISITDAGSTEPLTTTFDPNRMQPAQVLPPSTRDR
ncbi:hypothetical protein [Nocardia sp. NPDC127526]|uniref:hypothetical protein n=1 Tax=Nocardia sp. NPDC127526 TaxID=3345393 RepID=UPI00363BDBD6